MAMSYLFNYIFYFNKIFEEKYKYMEEKFTLFQISFYGTIILHQFTYYTLAGIGLLFILLPFMQKYKIQRDKFPSRAMFWKCLKNLLLNQFFIQIPMILGMPYFLTFANIPYKYDFIPRWYRLALEVFLCAVIEDTYHFFLHYLMHHPSLYKHVHKVHHEFTYPFSMTAEYAHPIETIVLAGGTFLGALTVCSHLVTIWAWMIARMIETQDVHSGYSLSWINPFNLIPGYAGAEHHDFHHKNFVGNYASTFVWWDFLFKTDTAFKKHQHAIKTKASKCQ